MSLALEAQEYYSLPDSNAVWVVSEVSSSGVLHFEYSLSEYVDDTLIGSYRYNKIFMTDASDFPFYAGAFRNDSNGRSYFVPPWGGITEEYLWYDFSLEAGDTAFDVALNDYLPGWYGPFDFVADSTKMIDVGPHSLKCIYLSPIPPNPPFYTFNSIIWVDGIGSLMGGIYNMYMCGLSATSLRCATINDTIYFFSNIIDCDVFYEEEFIYNAGQCKVPVSTQELKDESGLYCYPQPANNYFSIQSESPVLLSGELTIFNTLGVMVYSNNIVLDKALFVINTSAFPTGIYYLVFHGDGFCYKKKIIVQHQ